jgi:hypothetical protein
MKHKQGIVILSTVFFGVTMAGLTAMAVGVPADRRNQDETLRQEQKRSCESITELSGDALSELAPKCLK